MTQNTSMAVMAQRLSPDAELDDFPTPPWATRALIEHVLDPTSLKDKSVHECAAGRGHMARTLAEYFGAVLSSDIADYGTGHLILDYTQMHVVEADWVITNPPFSWAEDFALTALKRAGEGVALLTRTAFLEGVGRYNRLFRTNPPAIVAQFSERVPMVKGRLDRSASTATAYCWLVWDTVDRNRVGGNTEFVWIPPCRKLLEREEDYAEISQKQPM